MFATISAPGYRCVSISSGPKANHAGQNFKEFKKYETAAGITLGVVQPEFVNGAGVAPIIIYSAAEDRIVTIPGLGPPRSSHSLQAKLSIDNHVSLRISSGPRADTIA